jgi:rhamnogalacturonyl hydrolase YesR
MTVRGAASCFVLALLVVLVSPAAARRTPPVTRGEIAAALEKAADWQLQQPGTDTPTLLADPHGWSQAVFWLGLAELAERRPDSGYRDRILALGARHQWRLGHRIAHADDHLIGQTWLWAAAHGAGPESLSAMRESLDALVARQQHRPPPGPIRFPKCAIRLCWSDALFMSPPTLAGLSRMTGDSRYADLALAEAGQTIALLYDPRQRLFHRDDRFIGARDDAGRRLFWSRGNGWALAGIANLLRALDPGDPRAASYRRLFRAMADRVKDLQRPDGSWSAALLDRRQPPETSGTGLFVFALAWGVNAGLLDRNRYAPAVLRGWAALDRAAGPDGAVGWVQPIGDRPAPAGPQDRQPYGTGAFLLAGTQVLDMIAAGHQQPDRRSVIAAAAPAR